jgi:Ras-related protein Rab-18
MSRNHDSNISNKSDDALNHKFYKLKIILIGDSGVGKTSLLCRFLDKNFSINQPCTVNADFKIKTLNIDSSTSAELIIWDTCGQEKYRSLTKQFYKDAHGIILMFDVCDKRSFENLNKWLEEIPKNNVNENFSVVLCGNKIDLNRNVSYEEASIFAKNKDMSYCETSSKNGINIDVAFEKVTKDIIEKIKRKNKFEEEIRDNTSLNTSTKGVRGVKGDMKCC